MLLAALLIFPIFIMIVTNMLATPPPPPTTPKLEHTTVPGTAATPIYWINLDKSKDRMAWMSNMFKSLGLVNTHRIAAHDVSSTWSSWQHGTLAFHPHLDRAVMKSNSTNFALHVMGGSGLCSQLTNLLLVQYLYENVYHRHLLVDESSYNGYRRNSSEGVLPGFFTPQMPVLDEIQQRSDFAKRWFPPEVNSAHLFTYSSPFSINSSSPNSIEDAKGDRTPVVVSSVFSHEGHFRAGWKQSLGHDWYSIYHKLIPYACNNFQFNERTQKEINIHLREHNISTSSNSTNLNMVGFHVRRSDKVSSGEADSYTADTYLSKWIDSLDKMDNATLQNFTHCFVASDEYGAVEEFRVALDSQGIPCQLVTLTPSKQNGTDFQQQNKLSYEETLRFLAEISLLVDAKYFVGTMGSNVGRFVTLMRSCPAYFRGERINNATDELTRLKFYNSIGIDSKWFI